jgi:hypothetical protein
MADMVLDMVKARVNEDQGQDQTARQQYRQSASSFERQTPYDNTNNIQRSYTTPQTTRYSTGNLSRSRYSNRMSYHNVNRSTLNSNRPTIFNSILRTKYNPIYKPSSFSTQRRGIGSNRPWSRGRFINRNISNRNTNIRGISRGSSCTLSSNIIFFNNVDIALDNVFVISDSSGSREPDVFEYCPLFDMSLRE